MYTFNTLPTDGTIGPFPISFDYRDADDITVTLTDMDGETNPIPQTFTFHGTPSEAQPGGTSIRLSSAAASGKLVVIRKVIDLADLAVDWNTGAELSKRNLAESSKNLQEMAQTAFDVASTALERNQEVIDNIEAIIPENVVTIAAEIAADREAAEEAATLAVVAVASINERLATQIILDFGDGAVCKTFVAEVPGIEPGSYVRITQLADAAPGRSQDENELDTIICKGVVTAVNQITIYAKSLYGSVHGQYRFVVNY